MECTRGNHVVAVNSTPSVLSLKPNNCHYLEGSTLRFCSQPHDALSRYQEAENAMRSIFQLGLLSRAPSAPADTGGVRGTLVSTFLFPSHRLSTSVLLPQQRLLASRVSIRFLSFSPCLPPSFVKDSSEDHI